MGPLGEGTAMVKRKKNRVLRMLGFLI
jgi:hypothetical protein